MSDIEIVVNFHTLLCCHQDSRLFLSMTLNGYRKYFTFHAMFRAEVKISRKFFFMLEYSKWLTWGKCCFVGGVQ